MQYNLLLQTYVPITYLNVNLSTAQFFFHFRKQFIFINTKIKIIPIIKFYFSLIFFFFIFTLCYIVWLADNWITHSVLCTLTKHFPTLIEGASKTFNTLTDNYINYNCIKWWKLFRVKKVSVILYILFSSVLSTFLECFVWCFFFFLIHKKTFIYS